MSNKKHRATREEAEKLAVDIETRKVGSELLQSTRDAAARGLRAADVPSEKDL